ncbi:MAG: aldo/keto reductase [Planctomycetota bacterium]
MKYRPLGRTGLDVSILSYGASSLGGVFHDIDESQGVRTVHEVLDLGINLIDVSPYYGLTKAETVLGKALREIDRDRYILATKVGRYGDDPADFDFSADRVKASVDESLERLGVDHIDIIQCHDIEFAEFDYVMNEAIPALREVVAAGKAKFVGVTGLPLTVFTKTMDRLGPDGFDTILSYCHFELNDTTLLPIARDFAEKGLGVINASPTGMGLLTERGAPDWHPAPESIMAVCQEAVELCKSRGKPITDLAIAYAVSEPSIASTLVSSSNPANMRRNIAAAEAELDTELLADVQRVLQPVMDQTWHSGRPEYAA